MKLNQRETKMANITISDLRPAGADLFSDSESYLKDLIDQEMTDILGGRRIIITWTFVCIY
jgi:hypothetical protein